MMQIQNLSASLKMASVALLVVTLMPGATEAQQGGRFRVLVPNLESADGTRAQFGERTANELRNRIDLPTHVAMSQRDIDQAARQFDLRLANLDCITARQLAAQINIPLVFCGQYRTEDGLIAYEGSFFTVPAGEEFTVPSNRVRENENRQAADQIIASFEATIDQLSQISYCGQEFSSSNWDGALQYCTRAVELAPESNQARFALARAYMELGRLNESLQQFEILLERDPYDSNSLENAGWIATQIPETEKAFQYYSRFLELNPSNLQIRLRVAYDLAQAQDYEGAMDLLRAGFDQDPENVDLHEQFGNMAFQAAVTRQSMEPAAQPGQTQQVSPAVSELFRTAIASLERVIEARREEARPVYVTNSINAYLQLGDVQSALAFGQRVAQYFANNAQIQAGLASAHARGGNVDEAISHLQRALQIDPEYPNANSLMARYLLDANRPDEAVAAVRAAAARGEQTPDGLGGMLLQYGFANGSQSGSNFDMAIRLFTAAKELNVTEGFRAQANFFHGHALYGQALVRQEAGTPASAQATLPVFQQVVQLMNQAGPYAQTSASAQSNVGNIRDAAQQYIEIQEAIIRRGGSGG